MPHPDPPRPPAASGPDGGDTIIGEALYGLAALAVRDGPREISLTAASTLATLDRTGPRRLTDLAVIEGVSQPSMSVLVTGLEQAGLAERRRDPADGRVVLVMLTAAGADYLRARRRAGAETFTGLIAQLPDRDAAALAAAVPALKRMRELDNDQRAAVAARLPTANETITGDGRPGLRGRLGLACEPPHGLSVGDALGAQFFVPRPPGNKAEER